MGLISEALLCQTSLSWVSRAEHADPQSEQALKQNPSNHALLASPNPVQRCHTSHSAASGFAWKPKTTEGTSTDWQLQALTCWTIGISLRCTAVPHTQTPSPPHLLRFDSGRINTMCTKVSNEEAHNYLVLYVSQIHLSILN